MKRNIWNVLVGIIILTVLLSVSGSLYVQAQNQGNPGEEIFRPTQEYSDKAASPNAAGESVAPQGVGVPGYEVDRPVQAYSDKASAPDEVGGNAASDILGFPGGEPVLNVPAALAEGKIDADTAAAATLKWYTVAGSSFLPYTNAMTWTYGGSGCIAPSATGFWRASVNLPDGSIMKQIYFGFWNAASSTTSTAYLYRYNYLGSANVVTQVNSVPGTTTTGYYYTNMAFTDTTVANYTNAYSFAWSGSATQQLCYIQVGYIPPSVFGIALPMVVKQP